MDPQRALLERRVNTHLLHHYINTREIEKAAEFLRNGAQVKGLELPLSWMITLDNFTPECRELTVLMLRAGAVFRYDPRISEDLLMKLILLVQQEGGHFRFNPWYRDHKSKHLHCTLALNFIYNTRGVSPEVFGIFLEGSATCSS